MSPRRARWLVLTALLSAACSPAPVAAVDDTSASADADAAETQTADADPFAPQVEALLAQMTLDEKLEQLHGTGFTSIGDLYLTAENTRLKIPGFAMVDGARGVHSGTATTFPVGMARAATFNPPLEREVGRVLGIETRAKGANVLLAPTVNNLRHPRWGRAQETYGEDVFLLGAMGAAFVHGVQEHALTSLKHLAVNSIEDRRMFVDVTVDERTLHEIYLRHFEHIVRTAHPATLMGAYNSVNGHFCCENPQLLTDILRHEWGFPGLVMSDWLVAVRSTAPSLLAGLDIEMPAGVYFAPDAITAALTAGELVPGDVDTAVRRILHTKLEFLSSPSTIAASEVETPDHVALALQVAQESIVLLKNADQLLPLQASALQHVVVLGPFADTVNLGDTGSSNSTPAHPVTTLQGLRDRLGPSVSVTLGGATTLTTADKTAIAAADAVVLVGGLDHTDEGEAISPGNGGDRKSLLLPAAQVALIHAVHTLNPKTIVVLQGGSAIVVAPWQQDAAALLVAWYPGQEGGHAIADLLLGTANPSGHLPLSLVQDESQLPAFINDANAVTYDYWHGYRWLDRQKLEPSYPFGFGLSYSTFTLDPDVAVTQVGEEIHVKATVHNTSQRDGLTALQLYVSYPQSPVERPVRDLQAIQKVAVAAGAAAAVEWVIPQANLAYWDVTTHGWRIAPGTYGLHMGFSSRDLPVTAAWKL